MISKADFEALASMDDEARKVFLAMPEEEQRLAVLGVATYLGNEVKKLKVQVGYIENDLHTYRAKREREEKELPMKIALEVVRLLKEMS